ncbi:T9SS type A sorting domain-containing protein [uncultured Polaribacter sp.]|uniref:T9SS type A sorting domain-containing protein n=1 Tax=uncultured Polaribacter sp. TaxID=174711 RepID=UPI0026370879|nr:T9SS type A sorting domain-containing protein [uncultured Polaribacter sp.]
MIKKILFILFLSTFTLGFSQQKSLESLSAAPNPFSNSTKISFIASSKSTIIFTVRNVLGTTVVKKNLQTTLGKNTIPFFKNDLNSGMYIYSIQNKKQIISKRFVIR